MHAYPAILSDRLSTPGHRTFFGNPGATFHESLASKVPCRFLSVYLYSSMLLLLSPLLSSSLPPPHSLSVPLFLEPPSSPKNRQVRYYRRHITNAELVVIDWMPGTWICQLVWQTNPFRSSFSPRFLHHPPTFLRMSHFGERK